MVPQRGVSGPRAGARGHRFVDFAWSLAGPDTLTVIWVPTLPALLVEKYLLRNCWTFERSEIVRPCLVVSPAMAVWLKFTRVSRPVVAVAESEFRDAPAVLLMSLLMVSR